MEKSKKCGYTYESLDYIGIAIAGALKSKGQLSNESIQSMLVFYRSVLKICEENPTRAKALMKLGKTALEEANKEANND